MGAWLTVIRSYNHRNRTDVLARKIALILAWIAIAFTTTSQLLYQTHIAISPSHARPHHALPLFLKRSRAAFIAPIEGWRTTPRFYCSHITLYHLSHRWNFVTLSTKLSYYLSETLLLPSGVAFTNQFNFLIITLFFYTLRIDIICIDMSCRMLLYKRGASVTNRLTV